MQSDSDEATAKPSEPVWAGWALPVDADDKLLLSISAYASDVLAFTTAFLTRCGFVKMQRLAPTAVASESFKSLRASRTETRLLLKMDSCGNGSLGTLRRS